MLLQFSLLTIILTFLFRGQDADTSIIQAAAEPTAQNSQGTANFGCGVGGIPTLEGHQCQDKLFISLQEITTVTKLAP